jgi:hypothetical protein
MQEEPGMCTTLGILNGWWSVAGILVEIGGFIYLTMVAVRDVVSKFSEWVFAIKGLELAKLENRKDLESSASIYLEIFASPSILRLRIGGAIILVSLVLQLVGSWPCT